MENHFIFQQSQWKIEKNHVFLSDSVHKTDRPNYIDKSWEAPVVGTFSWDMFQEHYYEYKPPHQYVDLVTQPTQIEGVKTAPH